MSKGTERGFGMKGPSQGRSSYDLARFATVLRIAVPVLLISTLLFGTHVLPLPKALAMPGDLLLCSVSSTGLSGNGPSTSPAISSDGRYVAFASAATNLVPGDTNYSEDVFRKDLLTGEVALCSTSTQGIIGNGDSDEPCISGDGRFVGFRSQASNLVTNDTDSIADIFRKDLATGETTICSAQPDGTAIGGEQPGLSLDGQHAVFVTAGPLFSGESTGQIALKDLLSGKLALSSNATGSPAYSPILPSVNFDGSKIAFMNSLPRSGNDLYLWNVTANVMDDLTIAVSVGSAMDARLSADGRYLAFTAFRLVPNPGLPDAIDPGPFRMDLQSKEIVPCLADAYGNDTGGFADSIVISSEGRFVAFTGDPVIFSGGFATVFRRDMLTGETLIASVTGSGELANASCARPAISGDGRFIAFDSSATNLGSSALSLDNVYRKELPAAENAPLPSVPVGFGQIGYFAEGYTGSGFQEYLCMTNPAASLANTQVVYTLPDGTWFEQVLTVPPTSRVTIDVNQAIGSGKEVSVRIASDQAIVLERPMYFSYNGRTGGHVVTASPGISTAWYFAEGYTGPGFDQYVCVFNPSDEVASLDFHFQVQGVGLHDITGLAVGAHSRATFRVNSLLGEGNENSLELQSSVPVVAERSMYFDYNGWTGGSCVMGAASLANQYYFAEGTTRTGFAEYLTLQNPSETSITVDAEYQFYGSFQPYLKSYTLPATSRQTYYVPFQTFPDQDVSVKLTSASPFLAERPMYFDYTGYGANWTGGHCVIGASAPASEWFFAEGCTLPGFHEYLCLQNPGDTDATVEITYLTQEVGALPVQTAVVPAHSRITSLVNIAAGEGYQLSCRVRVVSGPAIVAERPMYFDFGGWDGGHDALGVAPTP